MAKILVSDDDPQILRLVSLCLEDAGHDVVSTDDPREVAALARRSAGDGMPFDVIVLDVMMTPLSGFEVMGELRRETLTEATPILLLSGRSGGSDRVRGLKEGADDYLTKPFEPEELELRVSRLVAWGERRGDAERRRLANGEANEMRNLGRYEVRGVLGQGTMGTVYRGWDPRLKRAVALKTIRLDSVVTEDQRHVMLDRLQNEAVTVARFNHPNIVAIYDMGDSADTAFIAMELVDGVSLSRYLREVGPLELGRLAILALAVARALGAAHERQVIHRDVKPGNVLLGRDGAIKVTDFGVADIFSRVSTEPLMIYGTPGYVPPEALRQEIYTQAGDFFGFGVILYEAASGIHPLAGENLHEILDKTLACSPQHLAERCPDLPGETCDLVMRLLATVPGERPSGGEVIGFFEELARSTGAAWSTDDLPGED